jgi:membrane-bound ClpP family serine protease
VSLVIAVVLSWLFLQPPWRYVVVAGALLFEIFEIWLFLHLRGVRSITGPEAMIGAVGHTVTDCKPSGQARIRGQYWQVTCDEGAETGDEIVVRKVNGLRLVVAPAARQTAAS